MRMIIGSRRRCQRIWNSGGVDRRTNKETRRHGEKRRWVTHSGDAFFFRNVFDPITVGNGYKASWPSGTYITEVRGAYSGGVGLDYWLERMAR